MRHLKLIGGFVAATVAASLLWPAAAGADTAQPQPGMQAPADNQLTMCTIVGTSGNDVLTGSENDDVICGYGGDDTLEGRGGNDKIYGGEGWDILDGGTGSDFMYGGPHPEGPDFIYRDMVRYNSRTADVRASIDGQQNDGEAGENDFIGDDIEAIEGGAGNDVLIGSAGNNGFEGGAGTDKIYGMAGPDFLGGGKGNDTLDGGYGSDYITGGAEFDVATYEKRSAPVFASLDNMRNDGESGEADYISPMDVEGLIGGQANDTLTGSDKDNILIGGGGNDGLKGMAGNDTLDGSAGADKMSGGTGSDTVSYAARIKPVYASLDDRDNDGELDERDMIASDVENLTGGSAGDELYGNLAMNVLRGNGGDDRLYARDGARDNLYGGPGYDRANVDNELDFLYLVEELI